MNTYSISLIEAKKTSSSSCKNEVCIRPGINIKESQWNDIEEEGWEQN